MVKEDIAYWSRLLYGWQFIYYNYISCAEEVIPQVAINTAVAIKSDKCIFILRMLF